MKTYIFAIILLAMLGFQTQASEVGQMCGYIAYLSNVASNQNILRARGGDTNNLDEVIQLTSALQNLDRPTKVAISQRLTFEDFQAQMAAKGQRVSEFYKHSYLEQYHRAYCVSVETESTYGDVHLPSGPITVNREQTLGKGRDINPADHKYFELMKSDRAPVVN